MNQACIRLFILKHFSLLLMHSERVCMRLDSFIILKFVLLFDYILCNQIFLFEFQVSCVSVVFASRLLGLIKIEKTVKICNVT